MCGCAWSARVNTPGRRPATRAHHTTHNDESKAPNTAPRVGSQRAYHRANFAAESQSRQHRESMTWPSSASCSAGPCVVSLLVFHQHIVVLRHRRRPAAATHSGVGSPPPRFIGGGGVQPCDIPSLAMIGAGHATVPAVLATTSAAPSATADPSAIDPTTSVSLQTLSKQRFAQDVTGPTGSPRTVWISWRIVNLTALDLVACRATIDFYMFLSVRGINAALTAVPLTHVQNWLSGSNQRVY